MRPLFCEGKRPVPVGGALRRPRGHHESRPGRGGAVPGNERLCRWLDLAADRVAFQGLPARICWLGYGERAAALRFNEMVAQRRSAPIVASGAITWTAGRRVAVPRDRGDGRRPPTRSRTGPS
ncbi:MAG: hypothetical protein U0V56_00550 [Actinomycetota bacterium]